MKFHREDVAVVVGVPEDAVANDDDKKEVLDEDAPMRDSRRKSRLVVVLLRARMAVVLGVGWTRDGKKVQACTSRKSSLGTNSLCLFVLPFGFLT